MNGERVKRPAPPRPSGPFDHAHSGMAPGSLRAELGRCSGGSVLISAGSSGSGGESDWSGSFSRLELRRLSGAGFLSAKHGIPSDVFADIVRALAPAMSGRSDDDVCFWWLRSALAVLDEEGARVVHEPSPAVHSFPPVVAEYLDRLVFEPKREYATALLAAFLFGEALPARPVAGWVERLEVKCERLADRVKRERVAVG